MSQINKLMDSVRELNPNLRFEELAKLLIKIGYVPKQPNIGSSHYTFRKHGKDAITIPKKNNVPKVYISMVRDALLDYESEGL